ncbi:hypothetical protein [Maricaulis sp.]|uniref:hypothetical protein n=1 Tax=Maricaulis sp. TaxID=1486257 RepID=UPI003297BF7F
MEAHFKLVAEILSELVDVHAQVDVEVNWSMSPAVAALAGEGCERISRNRGRAGVLVAPLKHLGQGLWAWLSYREEWSYGREIGGRKRFIFRSASMTVHFGWKFDAYKPQMFRAEWAGWADWGGAELGYQAGEAGHPHWQFDALESLSEEGASERAAMLRKILSDGDHGGVRDFIPQLPTDDVRDLVSHQQLSRIHFASAAAWWKASPNCDHAHSPDRVKDLQVWLRQTISYLSSELDRLQIA